MFDTIKKLKAGFTLDNVKSEIDALNQMAAEGTSFPRPVEYALTPENEEGFFRVRVINYEYLDWSVLGGGVEPTTFTSVDGTPPNTVVFA
jgi:hypothetical protein